VVKRKESSYNNVIDINYFFSLSAHPERKSKVASNLLLFLLFIKVPLLFINVINRKNRI
jgi:CTP synthase (UTP-ammonia lyase)